MLRTWTFFTWETTKRAKYCEVSSDQFKSTDLENPAGMSKVVYSMFVPSPVLSLLALVHSPLRKFFSQTKPQTATPHYGYTGSTHRRLQSNLPVGSLTFDV